MPSAVVAPSSTNDWPTTSIVLSPSNLPTRIFGPCRSAMIATSLPQRLAISRTKVLLMCCTFALVCKNTVSTAGAKWRFMPDIWVS